MPEKIVHTFHPALHMGYCIRIKRNVITTYNLLFHYCNATEISFYYFCDTKLSAKYKHAHANSIYIVGIMFVRYMNSV